MFLTLHYMSLVYDWRSSNFNILKSIPLGPSVLVSVLTSYHSIFNLSTYPSVHPFLCSIIGHTLPFGDMNSKHSVGRSVVGWSICVTKFLHLLLQANFNYCLCFNANANVLSLQPSTVDNTVRFSCQPKR